jgi:anti-sigma B factor antagonist
MAGGREVIREDRCPIHSCVTRMGDPGSEQSSVDARGIRPPDVYAIEARAVPGSAALLHLKGEFDLAAAPAIREHLDAARASGARRIVLDMAEVEFVDSSALRELLRADAGLRAGGGVLVLASLQPAVLRLLELTRTADVLTLAPDVEQALELPAE